MWRWYVEDTPFRLPSSTFPATCQRGGKIVQCSEAIQLAPGHPSTSQIFSSASHCLFLFRVRSDLTSTIYHDLTWSLNAREYQDFSGSLQVPQFTMLAIIFLPATSENFREDLVSPRQTSIYICDVPMGSWYMKSVIYHALWTVSENAYVKCRLQKYSRAHLTSQGEYFGEKFC